jgi:hypothetical protein
MAETIMSIETFKNKFDGGTRPNRFIVSMDTPEGTVEPILVKAASIPAETLGILQIPFRGRVAKLPGDRAYAEWTFTVLDDTTEKIRENLSAWHRTFNLHEDNIPNAAQTPGGGEGNVLGGGTNNYIDITVKQLSMTGADHTCVTLHKCWPVDVGAIDLSYDTADTATEFACTIAYDWLGDCGGEAPTAEETAQEMIDSVVSGNIAP